MLFFLGNPSDPLPLVARKVLVNVGEEKGKGHRARTRTLWRTNPTRTPLDYRVSHTTRGENLGTYLATGKK